MKVQYSKSPVHYAGLSVLCRIENRLKNISFANLFALFCRQQTFFLRISCFLLLLLTCLTTIPIYSQDIIPMLENGNLWSQITTHYPYGIFQTEETKKTDWLKVGMDTTINSKICKIILSANDSLATDWNFAFIMREDSGKVFYYDYGNEELLYDFGMEINDSIVSYIGGGYRVSKLISKVDTLIGNKVRKKYYFTNHWLGYNEMTFPEIWIEGIGSLFGLLRSSCYGITPCYLVEDLSCFYQNDTMKYQSCPTCKCYILVTSVDKIPGIKDLKVIPNPASDVLEISSPSILSGYEIFNQFGILIKKDSINVSRKRIDISGLIPGIYIIKIYDTNKHYTSTKIIIQ